jgi:hypothetical protein
MINKWWFWLLAIAGIYLLFVIFQSSDTSSATNNSQITSPQTTKTDNSDNSTYNDDESSTTFHGYDCTEDCSGHEAGYSWAEDHDITDPDECDGNSNSFIEGCQSYAEENGY